MNNSVTVAGKRIRLNTTRPPITPSYVLKGPPWTGGALAKKEESTGEREQEQRGKRRNSGPQAQLITVFSHQVSATLTQRPKHFSYSRTCSRLHLLGIKMEPRQEFLIDQTHKAPVLE